MNNQIFGVFISILAYYIGIKINEKLKNSLINPLLVSTLIVIAVLLSLNISYDSYMEGGSIISFLIMPATVSLVVPFYNNWEIFKKYKLAIFLGSLAGSLTSLVSVVLLGKLLSLDNTLLISIMPKSITSALALPVSDVYGGIMSLTSIILVFTGVIGASLSEKIFAMFNINDSIAKGVALGTSAHAVGTSKALELDEVSGAIASLCIILTGFITIIIFPMFYRLI